MFKTSFKNFIKTVNKTIENQKSQFYSDRCCLCFSQTFTQQAIDYEIQIDEQIKFPGTFYYKFSGFKLATDTFVLSVLEFTYLLLQFEDFKNQLVKDR